MSLVNDVARANRRNELVPWDNIDRLVTIGFRPEGHSRGAIPLLYERARGDNPISYEVTQKILAQRGAHVGILTGAAVPEFLPKGENDGPLGAIVLAQGLRTLGYQVTILAESELSDIFNKLFSVYGEFDMLELDKEDSSDHAGTGMDLDMLIAVEKLGSNAEHVMHGSTGISRNGTRAHVDGLVNRMNDAGKLTVGVGDGGNEIGFGKFYEYARDIIDYGKECRCPCEGGIITVTETEYLFPVGVSNWGAYALNAALAAATEEFSILHTAEREVELLTLATEVDCRDGATGTARPWVDGVPAETSASIVQILKTIAESIHATRDRPF